MLFFGREGVVGLFRLFSFGGGVRCGFAGCISYSMKGLWFFWIGILRFLLCVLR